MEDKKTKCIVLVEKADSFSQLSNNEVVLREDRTLHHSIKDAYIVEKFSYFLLCFLYFISFSASK